MQAKLQIKKQLILNFKQKIFMRQIFPIFILATMVWSCRSGSTSESDWIYLFDGASTEGWRAYNGDALPPQWVIKDGALTFDTEARLEADRKGGNDIIYGLEEFDNFELYFRMENP